MAAEICGNCKFFDLKRTNGKPVGITILQTTGELVNKGFCRAPKGLMFDINEKSECKQRPVAFVPKIAA